jgi:hypothetical protein
MIRLGLRLTLKAVDGPSSLKEGGRWTIDRLPADEVAVPFPRDSGFAARCLHRNVIP